MQQREAPGQIQVMADLAVAELYTAIGREEEVEEGIPEELEDRIT